MFSAPKTTIVDEKLIRTLVHQFYGTVRKDAVLGPIFEARIGDGWDAHLARMVDFWSSVLLGTGRYSGRPHVMHQALGIEREHFARWFTIFKETVNDLCSGAAREQFLDRAQRIAASLQAGLGIYPYADLTYEEE